jgi:hypothetical protein
VLGEPADPALGLDLARKSLVARPNWPPAIGALSHCLVRLGRLEEAKETQRQYLVMHPDFTLSGYRTRMPFRGHVADTIIDLHRLAGVPE